MDPWEFTMSLAVGLVFLYFFKSWFDNRHLPPGPWGIPVVGYMPFLLSNPMEKFQQMAAKYGKVFSLSVGNFKVVVLNDFKLITETFNQDVYTARPEFEVYQYRNHFKHRGILLGDGHFWSEHRRYILRNLRTFGFGKQATMDGLLSYEVQEAMNHIDEYTGKVFNPRNIFNAAVLNSLWFLCTGSRFDPKDEEFQFCVRAFTENLTKLHPTGVVFFFPVVLRQLARGLYKFFQESTRRVQGLVKRHVDEHRKTFDPNVTRDLLDTLIAKQLSTTDPASSFYGEEAYLNILVDLTDLFLAGAETTSTTLQWIVLYMITYPEIQEKVQEEIDRVLGTRAPTLADRASMTYVEATLNETHRYASMLPIGVFHSTWDQTEMEGYTIPKGTVVMANTRACHFDPTYWKDPETFDPSRFIDPVTHKLIKHDNFIPFSVGKRQCLGMELAKDTLFMFFCTLMQKYTLVRDPKGPTTLDLSPRAPSVIVAPKPYNVMFTPRNNN